MEGAFSMASICLVKIGLATSLVIGSAQSALCMEDAMEVSSPVAVLAMAEPVADSYPHSHSYPTFLCHAGQPSGKDPRYLL